MLAGSPQARPGIFLTFAKREGASRNAWGRGLAVGVSKADLIGPQMRGDIQKMSQAMVDTGSGQQDAGR